MKSTCKFAEYWMSVRIDGESMPAGVVARLDEHLRDCEACARLLESEERRTRLLKSSLTGDETALAFLKESILKNAPVLHVGTPKAAAWPRPRILAAKRLGFAAAALLLLGIGVLWMSSGNQEPTPSHRHAGSPWKISLETERWDLDPSVGLDGARWGRSVRRVRDVLLDPYELRVDPARAEKVSEGAPRDVFLDTERVDTRYIRLTGYSYH